MGDRMPRKEDGRFIRGKGHFVDEPYAFSYDCGFPVEVTGIASAINAIMRQIGGAVGAQVSAAIVSAHFVLGGRFPAESGFTAAFLMSGVGAFVALGVTFAIPAREAAPSARRPAEARA